jgi:hypothetical protein
MAKRRERNTSGTFLAMYEGAIVGPFTGREKAISEIKKIMPEPTDKVADIYHRVCQVKVKNSESSDEKEQTSIDSTGDEDVPFDVSEHSEGIPERTAL